MPTIIDLHYGMLTATVRVCIHARTPRPHPFNYIHTEQMRNVLDPKRFYKANDSKALPKYFQVYVLMTECRMIVDR